MKPRTFYAPSLSTFGHAVLGPILLSALLLSACDALLTEPAPAAPEVSVAFSVLGAQDAGIQSAFQKVDRAHLVFVRPDSARRDTIVRLSPRDGSARARLVLESKERVSALGVFAELRAGQAPLFEGSRVIRVEIGAPTSAEISLAPVPFALRADRQLLTLQLGDTTRLSTTLYFASGDTLAVDVGTWTSLDPQVVFVTERGLAGGRSLGETHLLVRYEDLADTVTARVVGGR